jgi:adenosylhomocysteine nucleosidase
VTPRHSAKNSVVFKKLWAITVAVPHEAAGILKMMSPRAEVRAPGIRAWEGRLGEEEVVLLQTGIGLQRARRAAQFLTERYPLTHLLSTGYCGGLREELLSGHAVVAESLVAAGEPGLVLSDAGLMKAVEAALKKRDIPFSRGILLTSPQPILRTAEKEKAARQTGATAVDMESYPLILSAAQKKIASVTVRFIVDALQDELTDTEAFLDDQARVKPMGLVKEVIRRPKILLTLPGLERMASQARAAMLGFCRVFFGARGD